MLAESTSAQNVQPFIDPKLAEFVEDYVTSFLVWDILVLYYHNSSLTNTADQVARLLGRTTPEIEEALQELSMKGLLRAANSGSSVVYDYSPVPHLEPQVERFVEAISERDKRLAILTIVLKKRSGILGSS